MYQDIEELKSLIRDNKIGALSLKGKIAHTEIQSSMLKNIREIQILLDLEDHLDFKVIQMIDSEIFSIKEIFNSIYYYYLNYRIFNSNEDYKIFFKQLSIKMNNELKNDGHFHLTRSVSLHDSNLIDLYIQTINPNLLNIEEYKVRFIKIVNKQLIFSMAEKKAQ
jgi:hypothetical protein